MRGSHHHHHHGMASLNRESSNRAKIPEIKIASRKIPNNAALKFVKDMKIGWNLGNTFDAAFENPSFDDELLYETAWCGVKTTKQMIDTVKKAGFNTIRIPVSWHNHVTGSNFTISKRWLDRVQQVVDYAMKNKMYVIINIHHDIMPGYYYPNSQHLQTSIKYVKSIWTQVATRFKNYNDHLIFEAVNEPRLTGSRFEWWLDMNNPECRDAVEAINKLNQVFVDTVRSTGGNNVSRYLMVPGYAAAPEYVLIDEFKIPKDSSKYKNRIIISVHAYRPYNFALQAPNESGSVSEWSVNSEESRRDIDYFMDKLYDKFVSKGIPVVIGEFGARDKNGNLQSRVEFAAYYVRAARARGITCCWWDNNAFYGNGENFGLLDRKTLKWVYPEIVSAMMKYAR
uniref:Beta-1,3-1,4-glucanase n=1 Tax=Caldicellulosiruptor sp. F32 TaxID=1214564 RepID=UPI000718AB59|nr:Chain A, Beta-1,3-1,4-glucanase [Caldicellulosiruptor sp. F32]4X0V_B Chain B, Beta-1,3-1,4-glucanase [Caldicellulosiruptor sp. F32]4X0V_C Chain C, Beta-1,3-1,4-glucanase [Caldicellulosiruptor sp. F32]4X0V_D Chain D, Beta-1,3-1,4-glucanase [Caldicellulosiruptor sp. F32]4X0V_E Chain E, Beta-1,3-1,4-glucanase [Caldicellulosiruptor sp. F32]4X0V_F Chain F, Beta-1,3-1,4-glucanase [Caldicellulosiruptor sp. F32]4X0V_G Chain G, Beta-1,3-1,4-glucanase [Caldicellulosiruptor sp. F32]4X0V_H Chain H, B